MVSYAEFYKYRARRRKAMERGLHDYLGVGAEISIYLDNGSFNFFRRGGEVPRNEYSAFVKRAIPDWYPIPQDYIPTPQMSDADQIECMNRTMAVNHAFQNDGYVPVLHISRQLETYLCQFKSERGLITKPGVALGGIVPNLLRSPKAMNYRDVLNGIKKVRSELYSQKLHVFGIGGTATLHIAALLKIDSIDSAGWRNRAARGIVQLPGRGDRIVANLGNWRGRKPDNEEWSSLDSCQCPACKQFGVEGLKANRIHGFCNRATHNLWTLLQENKQIRLHIHDNTYEHWYDRHLMNTIYRPQIEHILSQR